MLDSNVYDRIVEREGFCELLKRAIQLGHIDIVQTHIQEGELANIPDAEKRIAVLAVPGRKVATRGAVWDISRWGRARWGDGGDYVKLDCISKGKAKDIKDALIAATADMEADIFITEEVGKFPNRIRATGTPLKVWKFDELVAYVEKLGLT